MSFISSTRPFPTVVTLSPPVILPWRLAICMVLRPPSLRLSQRSYINTHATHVVWGCTCVIHAREYPITKRVRTETRICMPVHLCTPFIIANMNICAPQASRALLVFWGKEVSSVTLALRLKIQSYPPPTSRIRNRYGIHERPLLEKWSARWKAIRVKQNVIFYQVCVNYNLSKLCISKFSCHAF